MNFFDKKPVHMLPMDTTYIWKETKRVNRAALEELFGLGGCTCGASSLVPPDPQSPELPGSHPLRGAELWHLPTSSPEGARSGSPLSTPSPEAFLIKLLVGDGSDDPETSHS